MSAQRITAEAVIEKYSGAIQDYELHWTGYAALARVWGASGTGAWSVSGETGSAFSFHVPAGLSASASALIQMWTAFNSASGAGLTATGSASALSGLATRLRLAGGVPGERYECSGVLRTSSGRHLVQRFFVNVGA